MFQATLSVKRVVSMRKVLMRADLQKNVVNVKQTDIRFRCVDGVSESVKQNEIFGYINHYVQTREELEQYV